MRSSLLAVVVLLFSGCATRHHDVLIFGTDTSLGVNVSADPANVQFTNIAIGYKRREAVWMPLIVNATESAVYCNGYDAEGVCTQRIPGVECLDRPTPTPIENCKRWGIPYAWNPKYESHAQGVSNQVGGSGDESDTYSVFASFGGEAGGGTGQANVAVAQFFATGIAAQRLGANPSAARLISATPIDAEGEQAKGKVDALQSTNDTLASAVATNQSATRNASSITDCAFDAAATPDQRTKKLAAMAGVDGIRNEDAGLLKAVTKPSELETILARDSMRNLLADAAAACAATN